MKNDEWYGDDAGVGPARSGFCLAAGAGQRRYSQAGCFKECFKFNAFDMSHTTGGVLENAWASGRAGGGGSEGSRERPRILHAKHLSQREPSRRRSLSLSESDRSRCASSQRASSQRICWAYETLALQCQSQPYPVCARNAPICCRGDTTSPSGCEPRARGALETTTTLTTLTTLPATSNGNR